jgi:hypothetical protein
VCPKQESNLQSLGFKPSRSASWRIRASASVVPDGLEPPLPGCRPGVVAAGPRDYEIRSGSRGTRTHNGVTAPVFETGSSSGRMTSVYLVAGAGIEPTSGRSERPVLPLDDPASITKVRGAGLEPASPGSKPGSLPLADPRVKKGNTVPCGNRTRLASLEGWHLCRSAKGTKLRRQESNLRRGG